MYTKFLIIKTTETGKYKVKNGWIETTPSQADEDRIRVRIVKEKDLGHVLEFDQVKTKKRQLYRWDIPSDCSD